MTSPQVYNRNAGSSETDIFIGIGDYAGQSLEVLAYCLTQCAGTRAVENSDRGLLELDCVIHKIRDGLEGFVGSHAADIDFRFKRKLAVAQ